MKVWRSPHGIIFGCDIALYSGNLTYYVLNHDPVKQRWYHAIIYPEVIDENYWRGKV